MSFRERMGELEHVQPVYHEDVMVHLVCRCGLSYEIEIGDLIDIQTDGTVQCECGSEIEIPWDVRIGWSI